MWLCQRSIGLLLPGVIQCEFCGQQFTAEASKKRHMRDQHTLVEPQTCEICFKTFKNKNSLVNHKALYHKRWKNNNFLWSNISSIKFDLFVVDLACYTCNKYFKTNSTFRRHIRDYHSDSNEEFLCELCQKVFKTKGMLINHKSKDHRDLVGSNVYL